MKSSLWALLGLVAAACASTPPHAAAPAEQPGGMFRAGTPLALPASGYAFSADGAHLLVAAGATSNAYAVPLEDGPRTALAPFTGAAIVPISYFPNDARVLLRAGARLQVRTLDGQLRPLDGDARFLAWRGDGAGFWAIEDARDIYFYDAVTYARRLVFRAAEMTIAAISRDGRWLALLAQRSTDDANIFLVDLSAASPAPQRITEHTGNVAYGVFEFAADNRSLTYATNEHGPYIQAWRYDLASGQKTPVMQAQADVTTVASSPSGRYRVFTVGHGAAADVIVVDQSADQTLPLSGAIRDVRFNRDETQIAFRLTSDSWPNDIFVSDLNGEEMRRVVHAPAVNE